jgi:hypothetical protein
MRPLITRAAGAQSGSQSAQGRMQQFYGDAQLAGFGEEALSGILTRQLQSGGQVTGAFRSQLTRYADYAMGDPKVLAEIAGAMAEAQKEGKITSGVYEQLTKASPALAEAFKEMAGGQKEADAAAQKGSMTFERFNQVLMEGKLKALEPYNGALEAINNTVIGRFKIGLASIKEQLTSLGLGSFQELYGTRAPYSSTTGEGEGTSIVDATRQQVVNLQSTIQKTIMAVGPQIQLLMPGLIGRISGPMTQVSEAMVRVIIRGMTALDRFSPNINRWIGQFKSFSSQAMNYMRGFAARWDVLWTNFWKPVAKSLGRIGSLILNSFKKSVDNNKNALALMGENLAAIIDNLKVFIEAFLNFKKAIAPFTMTIMRFVNTFLNLFNIPVVSSVAAWVIAIVGVDRAIARLARTVVKVGVGWQKWRREVQGTNTQLNYTSRNVAAPGAMNRDWRATAIGMGGFAASSYVSENYAKDSQFAQGVAGGLASGSTTYMMGSMLARPGTALATAVPYIALGAAVMGVVEGINDARNQLRKDQAVSANQIQNFIYDQGAPQTAQAQRRAGQRARGVARRKVNRIMAIQDQIGGTRGLGNQVAQTEGSPSGFVLKALGYESAERKRLDALTAERDKLEQELGIKSGTTAQKQLNKIIAAQKKEMQMVKANQSLGQMIGKSADEVAAWADRNNKKLNQTNLVIKDLIKMAGYDRSAAENRGVAATRNLENLRPTENVRVKESQASLDAVNSLTTYLEAAKAGLGTDAGRVEADKALQGTMAYQTASYSAGHYKNYTDFAVSTRRELLRMMEVAREFGVSGDALQTLGEEVMYTVANVQSGVASFSKRSELDPKFLKDLRGQVTTYIQGLDETEVAGKSGRKLVKEGVDAMKGWLAAQGITDLTTEDIANLSNLLTSEMANAGMNVEASIRRGGTALVNDMWKTLSGANWEMTDTGLRFVGTKPITSAAAAKMEAKRVESATNQVADNAGYLEGLIAAGYVDPITGLAKDPSADTTTSRFARTMARHSAINSMIAGNRTITSGVRNYNLGSPSSDHLTGAAYDLTGQNLGAYAGLVRASGGFAEFHGGALNRHLHVVPGMGIGDTSTPISMGTSSGAAVVNNNYSIVVNAPEGSSPQAIADAVMARIAARQRDAMERR